ncbi:hypothetical protein [Methylobacterium sp. JK268]
MNNGEAEGEDRPDFESEANAWITPVMADEPASWSRDAVPMLARRGAMRGRARLAF